MRKEKVVSGEKVWVIYRNGGCGTPERIRAAKVRFIGDGGYNGGRCFKFETKGQVKAVYAAGSWSSVHQEGVRVEKEA